MPRRGCSPSSSSCASSWRLVLCVCVGVGVCGRVGATRQDKTCSDVREGVGAQRFVLFTSKAVAWNPFVRNRRVGGVKRKAKNPKDKRGGCCTLRHEGRCSRLACLVCIHTFQYLFGNRPVGQVTLHALQYPSNPVLPPPPLTCSSIHPAHTPLLAPRREKKQKKKTREYIMLRAMRAGLSCIQLLCWASPFFQKWNMFVCVCGVVYSAFRRCFFCSFYGLVKLAGW